MKKRLPLDEYVEQLANEIELIEEDMRDDLYEDPTQYIRSEFRYKEE